MNNRTIPTKPKETEKEQEPEKEALLSKRFVQFVCFSIYSFISVSIFSFMFLFVFFLFFSLEKLPMVALEDFAASSDLEKVQVCSCLFMFVFMFVYVFFL